jgi:hypothetical protein
VQIRPFMLPEFGDFFAISPFRNGQVLVSNLTLRQNGPKSKPGISHSQAGTVSTMAEQMHLC